MPQISAVIITYNEEQHIERCIRSLEGVADEILILDSLSTDGTRKMAENLGAKVIAEPWLGYAAMKNKANSLAANDFILCIDGDEALSPELQQSILAIKEEPKGAYSFNRLNNYYGKWLRHGGCYPDKKIRLFDRRKAHWAEKQVHETLALNQEVSVTWLQGDLLHYTCYNVQAHLQQIQHFTSLGAAEMKAEGYKPSLIRMFVRAKMKFIKMFFLKLGFLDGMTGFIVAMNSAYSISLLEAKLWQLWQDEKKA